MEDMLLNLAEKVNFYRTKFNADELEFYIQASRNINIQNIQGYITTRTGLDLGIGVRASIGKKVGFASTSGLDIEKIEHTVKDAIKIAENKPEDPDFQGFPDPMKGNKVSGLFDNNVYNADFDYLAKISKELESSAVSDKRISKFSFSLTLSSRFFTVSNTRGILESDRGTFVSGYVDVKAKSNGQETSGIDFYAGRTLDDDKILSLATGAVERATKMLNAKKLDQQFSGQLLLENRIVYDVLRPIEYNISAENHQNRRSNWVNKLGVQVANEKLTIIDDGNIREGYMTMKTDGEGVPMQTKTIIENGVLKNLIYDNYTAKKEGKNSTGNAIRGNYNTTPSLTSTNLILRAGNKNFDELVETVEKGIYATTFNMGAHMTDPVKGFFS